VGGGQTGAELIHYLLSTPQRLPGKLLWISKRSNFLPLDESPFTNELFTPNYSDYFYGLSSKDRLSILAEQKLASDGINNSLLEKIYQLLYQAEFLSGQGRCCSLYPGCELVSLKASPRGGWTLTLREGVSSSRFSIDADIVILATGFAYKFLPALEPIRHLLPYGDHGFTVRDDYSLEWNGSGSGKIYIQNGAKQYRGIADPNLSLMAWRSARIINSLAGTSIYDVAENNSVFDLAAAESAERMMEEDDYESTGHFPKVERAVVAVGPRRVVGP
jgi:lysine N6-hydroxylase